MKKIKVLDKKCDVCGKAFQTKKSRKRFCSPDCAHEGKKKRQRESKKPRPRNPPLPEKACVICQTRFVPRDNRIKTCSKQCSKELTKINNSNRRKLKKSSEALPIRVKAKKTCKIKELERKIKEYRQKHNYTFFCVKDHNYLRLVRQLNELKAQKLR